MNKSTGQQCLGLRFYELGSRSWLSDKTTVPDPDEVLDVLF
jgi:hypothetical protein